MYSAVFRLMIAVLLASNLIGCVKSVKTNNPMMNAIDQTMGTYNKYQAGKLLLVTMENELHQALSQGRPINTQDNLPALYNEFLENLADKYGLQRVADWPLLSLDIRCFVFQVASDLTTRELRLIEQEQYVESVHELQIYNTAASGYNDPLVELQEGFSEMEIERTHNWATGKGVKIAVIDTGIDVKHADLSKRISFKQNFVDKSNTRFEQDIHGTAIAGVIASNAGNAEGMVGIAPDAQIFAMKSCWQDSDNSQDAYCNTYTLAKAINVAVLKNVDIINLSLVGPPDDLLKRLVNKALEKNIIVVGAVHPDVEPSFPTHIDGVISASENPDIRQADTQGNPKIYAQGNKVISTTPNNKYDFYSGSSISTAHITGIVALMRQRQPHMTYQQVEQILIDNQSGSNPINACDIVATLVGLQHC